MSDTRTLRPAALRTATRRALAVGGATVVVAALTQLGREAVEEHQGRRARTYTATRVSDPEPKGRLAALVMQPACDPPRGWAAWAARAWAAPTTMVGALLAALILGRWRWSAEHGTFVVSGARSPLLAAGGFQANALGHVVVARPARVRERLLVHEVAHVRQAERLGPFTLPLYVWWLARHGYRNHPMERGARATTRAWLARTGQ